MFGALRRLLQSGDLRGVLQESRRAFSDITAAVGTPTNRSRQRALDDMNARGGVGNRSGRTGPGGAIDYLNAQGVDPAASASFTRQPGGGWATPAPGGGMVTLREPFGQGPRFRQQLQTGAPSPIEAPYEGFRVWPEGNRWNDGPIPPWQGGGRGPIAEPYWTEFGPFDEAYRPFMSNNPEWNPLDMNVPPAFGGPVDPYNPNLYRHPGQGIKSVIPFNEMMRARGSLFDDPRYMPPF